MLSSHRNNDIASALPPPPRLRSRAHLIIGLSCALCSLGSAIAQDVQITGDVTPSPATSPVWTVFPGSLVVGNTNNGTLLLSGAGTVTAANSTLGQSASGSGIATVTGGIWANSSGLTVGQAGSGTLSLGGGLVSSPSVVVASQTGSTGAVNLTGGTLLATQVAEGLGSGTVTFNGGTLQLSGSQTNLFAGFEVGDVILTNSGGSIDTQGFNAATALGLTGNGPFNKLGTGTLSLSGSNTYLGRTTVRTGTLLVTGGISHPGAELYVGRFAGDDGTLLIDSGGSVSSGAGRIARSAGSTGFVQVTNGTWTVNGGLLIGEEDAGTLDVLGGGAVTSTTTTLALQSNGLGTFNLAGGTLTTGQLSEGSGSGTVNFNGGTLRLSTNQANLFAGFEAGDVILTNSGGTIDTQGFNAASGVGLTGGGSLTKTGTGTLTLSASNTHTGGTTVRQGTLVLNGASASLRGTQLTVGRDSGDDAFLRNEGGSISLGVSEVVDIARDAGSQGTVTMTGGTLTTFDLYVGNAGNGTFTMTGGTLDSRRTWIGNTNGATGLFQLGGDAVWGNPGVSVIYVGNLPMSTGTLEISGNAQINAPAGVLQIGGQSGSSTGTGTVNMSGGSVSLANVRIGELGTGDFFLSGGTVTTANTSFGSRGGNATLTMTGGTLVNTSSSGGVLLYHGTFNLQGGSVYATNGSAEMRVGDVISSGFGTGTFNLTGGSITNTIGNIGRSAGSTGIVNASGGVWHNSAELIAGNAGTGTLTLSGTAQITSAETIVGRLGSGIGTLRVSGGTLATGQLSIGRDGAGTFNMTGGTLSSTTGILGENTNSTGSASVSGGLWTNSSQVVIGRAGAGTLTTGGNTTIHASEFVVGSLAGSTGHLQINSGFLYGGQFSRGAGSGSMTFNGGTILLTAHQTNLFAGFADGEVSFAGNGWINTQEFNASTSVGLSGDGTLWKLGSGSLTLSGTNLMDAGLIIREGTVRITGSHTTTSGIIAGFNPFTGEHGFLEIADGGSVNALQFTAGQFEDAIGTLRITDGSLATSAITLANRGNGFLELGPGGSITTTNNVFLGLVRSTSITTPYTGGNAQITGGTWTIGGALVIGRLGTGIMEISGSGSVASGSTLLGDFGAGIGTLNLLGGSLTTGQVSEGAATGTVNFDGGTLRLSTNQSNLFAGFEVGDVVLTNSGGTIDTQGFNVATALGLTGNGSLTKTGTGTLTLSGTNTYTGPTTIEQGTLALNGTLTASELLIESGVRLIGTGMFGDLVLDPGSFVAPGNSIGTLSGTSLTWNPGATFVFDLGPGGTGDLLDLSGDFTKGGSGVFDFSFVDAGWETGQTYTLIEFLSTSFTAGDFTHTNGGGFDGTFALNPNSLTFTVTAVPEPSVAALVAAAAGLLAWQRLRSRRRS